jgi:hypothetical protein
MSKVVIYGIRDPRDKEFRYIGMTSSALEERAKKHMYLAKRKPTSRPVYSWLKELVEDGVTPEFVVIDDDVLFTEAEKREAHWIRHYESKGAKLFNIDNAGWGFTITPKETTP